MVQVSNPGSHTRGMCSNIELIYIPIFDIFICFLWQLKKNSSLCMAHSHLRGLKSKYLFISYLGKYALNKW